MTAKFVSRFSEGKKYVVRALHVKRDESDAANCFRNEIVETVEAANALEAEEFVRNHYASKRDGYRHSLTGTRVLD